MDESLKALRSRGPARGPARPIAAVIWDVDGTLADTLDLCVEALQFAIRHHGGPDLTPEEVRSRFGPTEEGILADAVGDRWHEAIETYLDVYESHHNGTALTFDGVRDIVLELAAAGVRQAVVTGKGERSARITLQHVGLEESFDAIEAGSDGGSVKEAAITAVVTRWGLEPGRVAYVGDVPSDVDHARAASVIAVSAAWKPDADTAALEERAPDFLLRTQGELASWVEEFVDRP
jgi:phosphoglycolate phosphatase/pyrophosphatase PpaX